MLFRFGQYLNNGGKFFFGFGAVRFQPRCRIELWCGDIREGSIIAEHIEHECFRHIDNTCIESDLNGFHGFCVTGNIFASASFR